MDLHVFAAYRLALSSNDHISARKLRDALTVAEQPRIRAFAKRLSYSPSEIDDLVQAGNLGFLRALEKFDPAKGTWGQFSKRWIFDAMDTDVVEVRPIARVVGRRQRKMPRAVRREAYRIAARTGRPATAQELGISEEDLEMWSKKATFLRLEEATVDGFLPSNAAPSVTPQRALIATDSRTILTPAFWRALASLEEPEARVFLSLVVDEKPLTEVARIEGHEERWARATYNRAVEKMRASMAVP